MALFEQYPDSITLTLGVQESVYDKNTGIWSDPIKEEITFKCRFIPSSNKAIKLQDGTDYIYSYVVAIPYGSTGNILPLTKYVGLDRSGVLISEGDTKMFHISQLHSKLWV